MKNEGILVCNSLGLTDSLMRLIVLEGQKFSKRAWMNLQQLKHNGLRVQARPMACGHHLCPLYSRWDVSSGCTDPWSYPGKQLCDSQAPQ